MRNMLKRLADSFTRKEPVKISLLKDPRNLRPAVDALMTQVEQASARLRANQPLVILLGEEHATSAHIAFQIMALQELQDRHQNNGTSPLFKNAPLYCMEYPHNSLEVMLEEKLDTPIPSELRGRIAAADQNGQFLLSVALAVCLPPEAGISRLSLFNHYLKAGLHTQFSDAAIEWRESDIEPYLDQIDSFTEVLVAKHQADMPDHDVNAKSPQGMRLRNIAMVENTLQTATDLGTRLIVQQCGKDHMFGRRLQGEKAEDSLSVVFVKAGAAVLPVVIGDPRDFTIDLPKKYQKMFQHALLVTDMDESRYNKAAGKEKKFLKDVFERSNASIEIFNPNTMILFDSSARRALKNEIKSKIPLLLEVAAKTPPRRMHGFVPS